MGEGIVNLGKHVAVDPIDLAQGMLSIAGCQRAQFLE
jgi:hypothetical protein